MAARTLAMTEATAQNIRTTLRKLAEQCMRRETFDAAALRNLRDMIAKSESAAMCNQRNADVFFAASVFGEALEAFRFDVESGTLSSDTASFLLAALEGFKENQARYLAESAVHFTEACRRCLEAQIESERN